MTHTSGDAQSERHLNRRIAEQVSVVDLRVERARRKATDRSRRKVPISPPLVAMLRAHRATQEVGRIAAAN